MLRVATYNIAHGRGGALGASNWTGRSRKRIVEHLRSIGNLIKEQRLDFIVLNEVDFSSAWSRHLNQARIIAEEAGFPYVAEQRSIDVAFPLVRFQFGNALLSKYPIADVEFVEFPPLSIREKRLAGNHDALLAVLDTPSGFLRVLAVHLEVRDEGTRVRCSERVGRIVEETCGPILVLGDFNSAPGGYPGHHTDERGRNAIDRLLLSGLFPAGPLPPDNDEYLSFPSAAPDRAIDWIFAAGECEIRNQSVVDSKLSDHLMVVADVAVPLPPDR